MCVRNAMHVNESTRRVYVVMLAFIHTTDTRTHTHTHTYGLFDAPLSPSFLLACTHSLRERERERRRECFLQTRSTI